MGVVVGGLVAGFLVLPVAAAQAKLAAKVTVPEQNGPRVVVALSSTTKLSSKSRPNRVQVRSGSTVFTLKRYAGARSGPGSWRTARLKGTAVSRARGLRGKVVRVVIRSRAGTTTLRPKVATPTVGEPTAPTGPRPSPDAGPAPSSGPGPSPTPGTPPDSGPGTPPSSGPGTPPDSGPPKNFPAPGRDLTGQEALASFGPYFFNSEFSDCFAGSWPACTIEHRYGHGSDGTFVHRRCTPTSGSDVNFVDAYQVVGALHRADGSWVVEYTTQDGAGFYHWEVAQNGLAQGDYRYLNGEPEPLRDYVWRQPANMGRCVS